MTIFALLEDAENRDLASQALKLLWSWWGVGAAVFAAVIAIKAGVSQGWSWAQRVWTAASFPFMVAGRLSKLEHGLTALQERHGALEETMRPYAETWDAFGVCWAYGEGEQRNIPYCPHCRGDGKIVPLDVEEGEMQTMLLSCSAHPLDGGGYASWSIDLEKFEDARCRGVAAGNAVTSGVDRVRGEPRYGSR